VLDNRHHPFAELRLVVVSSIFSRRARERCKFRESLKMRFLGEVFVCDDCDEYRSAHSKRWGSYEQGGP
jgi:hypothetical protein